MVDPTSQEPASASATTSGEPADAQNARGEQAEPKKRRRRRRGGKGRGNARSEAGSRPGGGSGAEQGVTATPDVALDPGLAALAGGLLSHIDDRTVPCVADGCSNTWVWTAAEQIQAYGQAAPRRECASCANVSATEVRCSVDGCRRTWTWSREAQLKHRSWNRRRGKEAGKKRRRSEAAPRRKCDLCHQKSLQLSDRPSVCKVHGCTRPVVIERDAQLRAWANLATKDLSAEGALPKHMCDVCREFCRAHDDRKAACGRPGCDRTWTYKRGAQLQAFLAGRFEDPMRLCGTCESESRASANLGGVEGVPANVEIMPCIVSGCPGTWRFRAGTKVAACRDGEVVVDRMCDQHRVEHGATVSTPESSDQSVSAKVSSESDGEPISAEAEPAVARSEVEREEPPHDANSETTSFASKS